MIHIFVVSKNYEIDGNGFDLGQSRLFRRDITPLLDDWFLDLSGVSSAPGANFLGNVNAFLLRFQKWHKFGDKLARLLGFEVASFFRHLCDDSLLFIETFLWAGCGDTCTRSTKLSRDFFTISLWCVFDNRPSFFGTSGHGPFATFGRSSVSLGDICAFFFKFFNAVNNIVLDLMRMVSSFTVRFINSFTFFFTFTFAEERSVAEFDGLFTGCLLVFNETGLGEGLFTFFLLLGLEIRSVGGVALLTIAMLASDDVIVLNCLFHDNLVDTSLSSGSNGADAQVNFFSFTLTLATSFK